MPKSIKKWSLDLDRLLDHVSNDVEPYCKVSRIQDQICFGNDVNPMGII